MEARLNFFENPIAPKLIKYINSAGKVVTESSLPRTTQELVKIRASTCTPRTPPRPGRPSSD
jgi:hypothetical protein